MASKEYTDMVVEGLLDNTDAAEDHMLRGVRAVIEFGAKKYAPDDWYTNTKYNDPKLHIAAAYRHLKRHYEGNMFDGESDLPHIDHAVTRLMMARYVINNPPHSANGDKK